jgi:hypothetical protein
MSRLFETFSGDDDEVMLQMVKLLGKLPESWWTSWDARDHWFDENGTPLVDPETGRAFANTCILEDLLSEGVHFGIGGVTGRPVDITVPPNEREILENLFLQMLKYDPQSRLTILYWIIYGLNYKD